jgi:NitT/TauT family transport system permease protein
MYLRPEVYQWTGAFVCREFAMQEQSTHGMMLPVSHRSHRRLINGAMAHMPSRRWWYRHLDVLMAPVALALFVGLWQAVIWLGDYPAFILPSPGDVATTFSRALADGTLWRHSRVTLSEVFAGLGLGLVTATALGYVLAKSLRLERLLAPYLVASQSVPVVAIAPLLIIWFGSGRLSKVLVCALIVFFPVLVNTIVGIRSVEENLRDLMRSLGADRWQTFRMLEVPAASPVLLGGLKIGVTLSVVGAVVGEFVGADQGLGFLINQARGLFNTPLVFVAILALVTIALVLYGTVLLLEVWLLRWHGQGSRE